MKWLSISVILPSINFDRLNQRCLAYSTYASNSKTAFPHYFYPRSCPRLPCEQFYLVFNTTGMEGVTLHEENVTVVAFVWILHQTNVISTTKNTVKKTHRKID